MRRPFALMTAVAVTAGGLTLTPPASPATIEARTLQSPGQTSPAAQPTNIQRTEVCFTVHNIGDPLEQQVSGTLFHHQNSPGGGSALLLQHGSVSDRSVWDGGRPTLTGVPSIAEQLAGAGYDVFAIDRLGYERSPYLNAMGEKDPGSGWTLTLDSQLEMTHEMVDQIRAGTYRTTTDACPGGAPAGRPASKVVLMGQSLGAALIEYYATRYHDIDGLVPLDVAYSSGDEFGLFWLNTMEKQWAEGKDYVYLFWGPDGTAAYSQDCEKFLFYADGVSEDVVAQVCGPGYFGGAEPRLTPSGEFASVFHAAEVVKQAIGTVGPTPVLLVFADKSAIFTNAQAPTQTNGLDEKDVITPEMEIWTTGSGTGCNCDVEFLWQRNAGHHLFFHDSATEMTADVIEWLRSRGL